MHTQRKSWISVVESGHENRSRYDEEEGDGSENAVGGNQRLVARHVAKAIAHA